MSNKKPALAGVQPNVKKPRRQVVSAPRSKQPKTHINFRIRKDLGMELEAAAQRHHLSRSHILVGAVERCLHDDLWRKGARKGGASKVSLVPPPELVELSNVLVALAFTVNELLGRKTKAKLDQASRHYLDAVHRLQRVREDLGC